MVRLSYTTYTCAICTSCLRNVIITGKGSFSKPEQEINGDINKLLYIFFVKCYACLSNKTRSIVKRKDESKIGNSKEIQYTCIKVIREVKMVFNVTTLVYCIHDDDNMDDKNNKSEETTQIIDIFTFLSKLEYKFNVSSVYSYKEQRAVFDFTNKGESKNQVLDFTPTVALLDTVLLCPKCGRNFILTGHGSALPLTEDTLNLKDLGIVLFTVCEYCEDIHGYTNADAAIDVSKILDFQFKIFFEIQKFFPYKIKVYHTKKDTIQVTIMDRETIYSRLAFNCVPWSLVDNRCIDAHPDFI